jgi:hypothetical protein
MKSRWPKPNNCYQAAFRFLTKHPEYVLVHAVSAMLLDTGHAWIETPDRQTVLEVCRHPLIGTRREIPAAEYYEAIGARNLSTFTLKDACNMALVANHYGPWGERP